MREAPNHLKYQFNELKISEVRYADQVLNLNDFANWLLGYLSKKLLVEVVVPGVSALRHNVMYFIPFGWMFYVKTKDGPLVAIWFAKEIRNQRCEEMDSIYCEKVEPYTLILSRLIVS